MNTGVRVNLAKRDRKHIPPTHEESKKKEGENKRAGIHVCKKSQTRISTKEFYAKETGFRGKHGRIPSDIIFL